MRKLMARPATRAKAIARTQQHYDKVRITKRGYFWRTWGESTSGMNRDAYLEGEYNRLKLLEEIQ
jgi:hypothetical protein